MTSELASSRRRVGAYLLDCFLIWIPVLPVALVWSVSGLDVDIGTLTYTGFYVVGVVSLLAAIGLLALFDGSPRGQTPGKFILRIRVADAEDTTESIGYRRALIRRIVWLFGGLCLYFGWLAGLQDRRRQAWHDKAAHSVVVTSSSTAPTSVSASESNSP